MADEIRVVRKGASMPFTFDLDGDSIEGWVCTINVRQFPSDSDIISRVITPVGSEWPGFLTPAETDALSNKLYRLTGVLTNASTGEEEQVPVRFNITDAWG